MSAGDAIHDDLDAMASAFLDESVGGPFPYLGEHMRAHISARTTATSSGWCST
jgi:hypothetical protein